MDKINIHETYTIYPIFLDSTRSIKKGRKYNKNYCVPNIQHSEITSALNSLEIPFLDEPTKRHPKEPFVFGRLRIPKNFEKKFVLNGIKNVVEEDRIKIKAHMETMQSAQENASVKEKSEKRTYIKNDMNLIPKKKIKKKKK
ncbi:hypothetical protein EDEG_03294 [Edhazardia aedis USNM 41457]|uniref:SRP19 protein n=1 Tax=Edhazardia aedis (strain USNM 41457) TaxID=1003232 RepID=J9DI20_EDHAE|nr:hypothetical protein EDEG_03294 [Edhazardia aedis USNM 41457]|eukprot:EJW02270.1 hypothetical protein EDEG_03294 [Edhazardia aedis USNM 41457]